MPSRPILHAIVAGYGAVFWLFNGADKFVQGRAVGGVRWGGRDRSDQLAGYVDQLDISFGLARPALVLVGIFEVVLGCLFVVALSEFFRFGKEVSIGALRRGVVGSVLLFTLFSAVDVMVGDRRELLEHGTFIAVFLVAYTVVVVEHYLASPVPGRSSAADGPGVGH